MAKPTPRLSRIRNKIGTTTAATSVDLAAWTAAVSPPAKATFPAREPPLREGQKKTAQATSPDPMHAIK